MAYDIIPVVTSDRVGSNAAAPVAGDAGNGVKFDNSTQSAEIIFFNDGAGSVVLSVVNSPAIENVVDGMVVADKPIASVAVGEMVSLGRFLNSEYGNDDPDGDGLTAGKTILINYTSGDGGKFFASVPGGL